MLPSDNLQVPQYHANMFPTLMNEILKRCVTTHLKVTENSIFAPWANGCRSFPTEPTHTMKQNKIIKKSNTTFINCFITPKLMILILPSQSQLRKSVHNLLNVYAESFREMIHGSQKVCGPAVTTAGN